MKMISERGAFTITFHSYVFGRKGYEISKIHKANYEFKAEQHGPLIGVESGASEE